MGHFHDCTGCTTEQPIRKFQSFIHQDFKAKRKEGLLGSSVQAKVIIGANENVHERLKDIDLPELFICSDVEVNLNNQLENNSMNVEVELASGGKCLRCWKVVKEVKDEVEICNRCSIVVKR